MAHRTGIVKDGRYLRHGSEYIRPETPQRLVSIYEMLDNPNMSWKYSTVEPRYAEREELELIHSKNYVDLVASTAGKPYFSLDPDTETTEDSYDVARLAVGGLCNAIDAVLEEEVDNAFAFVRPPGHHAERDRAAGFCLFNNVAIGAMHALAAWGMKRVLIVDWDLHHGNGTQHSFYEDDRVLYFSTHQYPCYPGTGSALEVGRGKGLGYTANVPLRPGADDALYTMIFRRMLRPIARQFQPDLILCSAGFDTYYNDPLGGMKVTPRGFACLTRSLMEMADECCGGRLVFTLEGGYHIQGLTDSVREVLQVLWDETAIKEQELERLEREAAGREEPGVRRAIDQLKLYWQLG